METKPVKKLVKPKHQVAKELCERLYINSVARVVEIVESKPGVAAEEAEVKKMLHRRFNLAVAATEIFMNQWHSNGKGRFLSDKE